MPLIDLRSSTPAVFYDFFPQFNLLVGDVFRNGCQSQIQAYHHASGPLIDSTGLDVSNCLYNVSSATRQITYAGTGILLGLLPTILSIFGSNTWETALLSTKRPLLSFLLALGAPVVTPSRLFDPASTDPRPFLSVPQAERMPLPMPTTPFLRRAVCVIEYALALATIANVTSISIQLGVMAFSPGISAMSERYHWLLWAYLAATIHMFGLLAFYTRGFKLCRLEASNLSQTKGAKALFHRPVRGFVADEFRLCCQCEGQKFVWRRQNLLSFLISAWISFYTVIHIIYRTITFSTTQLLLGADAVGVTARFMASAIVCRAVLIFELHGLRHVSGVELARD